MQGEKCLRRSSSTGRPRGRSNPAAWNLHWEQLPLQHLPREPSSLDWLEQPGCTHSVHDLAQSSVFNKMKRTHRCQGIGWQEPCWDGFPPREPECISQCIPWEHIKYLSASLTGISLTLQESWTRWWQRQEIQQYANTQKLASHAHQLVLHDADTEKSETWPFSLIEDQL